MIAITIGLAAACGGSQPEWRCREQPAAAGDLKAWLRSSDGVQRFKLSMTDATQVVQTRTRNSAGETRHYDIAEVDQDRGELVRLRLDERGCTEYFTHLRAASNSVDVARLVRLIGREYFDMVARDSGPDGSPTGYDNPTKGPVREFRFNLTQGELTLKLANGSTQVLTVDLRTGEQSAR